MQISSDLLNSSPQDNHNEVTTRKDFDTSVIPRKYREKKISIHNLKSKRKRNAEDHLEMRPMLMCITYIYIYYNKENEHLLFCSHYFNVNAYNNNGR